MKAMSEEKTMTDGLAQFVVDKEADINRTSRVATLSPELQYVVENFPPPEGETTAAGVGWLYDPDRGYDGAGWTFSHCVTGDVVHCYRRWDVMRVATLPYGTYLVIDFVIWLFSVGRPLGIIKDGATLTNCFGRSP